MTTPIKQNPAVYGGSIKTATDHAIHAQEDGLGFVAKGLLEEFARRVQTDTLNWAHAETLKLNDGHDWPISRIIGDELASVDALNVNGDAKSKWCCLCGEWGDHTSGRHYQAVDEPCV